MTKYGYARVSTLHQDLDTQIEMLNKENVDVIYSEKFTGTSTDRPKLNQLMGELQKGDTLIVTKLDRLARNTKEGIEIIEQLFQKGIRVHVLNVGLLENTTMGNFFLQTLLAVAEMERNLIVERTQEGKKFARENNANFREGRPRIAKARMDSAFTLKEVENLSFKQLAEKTGISIATLKRESARRKAEGRK